jgi:hypothetical protein
MNKPTTKAGVTTGFFLPNSQSSGKINSAGFIKGHKKAIPPGMALYIF